MKNMIKIFLRIVICLIFAYFIIFLLVPFYGRLILIYMIQFGTWFIRNLLTYLFLLCIGFAFLPLSK